MPAAPIPPLDPYFAELVARDAAPDVYRLHAIEHHGEAALDPVRPPDNRSRELLERVRARAAAKGWAWDDVLEMVRNQLGLTADFLKPGSDAQHVLDNVRKRQAARQARAQRMALA